MWPGVCCMQVYGVLCMVYDVCSVWYAYVYVGLWHVVCVLCGMHMWLMCGVFMWCVWCGV